jgi:hypothetical protein
MKKCTDCKYCIEEDYGYSNYTVEGTDVDCLIGAHPNFPVDRWYGEEPELEYAENCEKFSEGECVQVDCDRDEGNLWNYSDDPEIIELLKKRASE